MSTLNWSVVLACVLCLPFGLVACGDDDHHGDGGHGDEGGAVTVPHEYPQAVEKCEELSKKIGSLIESGELDKVHAVAADIKKIAEKLPELANEQLPASMLKEVNLTSRELAAMFDPIDKAGDAGDKAETQRLHEKMKGLIADLKKHSEHAKEEHHDD